MLIKILGIIAVIGILGYFLIYPKSTPSETPNQSMDNQLSASPKMEASPITIDEQTRYQTYSLASYTAAKDNKRVLFFHATWCPTCKLANEDFITNSEKIPENIIVLRTDYDTERELKTKYAITYQHTFVQVDEEGNQVVKWNGGGLDELIQNVK